MRGRKPIPTALHEMKGTLRATRHIRDRIPLVTAEGSLDPEPPEWMTESQQASWRYAIEHAPANLLKQIDRGMLAVWVISEDDLYRATQAQATLDASTKLPMLLKDK